MLGQWISTIGSYIFPIGVVDVIDIALVSYVIYRFLLFIKGTSSARVAKGIMLLLVALWVSQMVGLNMINFIISKTISLGVLALVIIFQPEIRRALERFGGRGLERLFSRDESNTEINRVIVQTVQACSDLSWSRYGALIVFEKDNSLNDYIRTGTVLDAELSAELMKNIFFPKAALHDGAVIVRDGRISAAGCMLPMTNTSMNKEYGMRHRAGVGMSENSDAVVVIVSEERGSISVAMGGTLRTNLSKDSLDKFLRTQLIVENGAKKKPSDTILNVFKVKKNDKKDT